MFVFFFTFLNCLDHDLLLHVVRFEKLYYLYSIGTFPTLSSCVVGVFDFGHLRKKKKCSLCILGEFARYMFRLCRTVPKTKTTMATQSAPIPTTTTNASSDIQEAVQKLVSLNINFLALDWDQTFLDIHTVRYNIVCCSSLFVCFSNPPPSPVLTRMHLF